MADIVEMDYVKTVPEDSIKKESGQTTPTPESFATDQDRPTLHHQALVHYRLIHKAPCSVVTDLCRLWAQIIVL